MDDKKMERLLQQHFNKLPEPEEAATMAGVQEKIRHRAHPATRALHAVGNTLVMVLAIGAMVAVGLVVWRMDTAELPAAPAGLGTANVYERPHPVRNPPLTCPCGLFTLDRSWQTYAQRHYPDGTTYLGGERLLIFDEAFLTARFTYSIIFHPDYPVQRLTYIIGDWTLCCRINGVNLPEMYAHVADESVTFYLSVTARVDGIEELRTLSVNVPFPLPADEVPHVSDSLPTFWHQPCEAPHVSDGLPTFSHTPEPWQPHEVTFGADDVAVIWGDAPPATLPPTLGVPETNIDEAVSITTSRFMNDQNPYTLHIERISHGAAAPTDHWWAMIFDENRQLVDVFAPTFCETMRNFAELTADNHIGTSDALFPEGAWQWLLPDNLEGINSIPDWRWPLIYRFPQSDHRPPLFTLREGAYGQTFFQACLAPYVLNLWRQFAHEEPSAYDIWWVSLQDEYFNHTNATDLPPDLRARAEALITQQLYQATQTINAANRWYWIDFSRPDAQERIPAELWEFIPGWRR